MKPLSNTKSTIRLDPDLYELLNKAKLQRSVELGRHVSFSEIIRNHLAVTGEDVKKGEGT